MIKEYIRCSFRSILKNRLFSVINILGLTIGMTCVLIIALLVQNELSYESCHSKANNIYQVYFKIIQGDSEKKQQNTSPVMAEMLANEFPEVEDALRMGSLPEMVFKCNNKMIIENRGIASDISVFNILTLPFVEGSAKNALDDPHSIVLTEKLAERYFGNSPALGKEITLNNNSIFKVTGVIKDLPTTTYLKFDYIVPFLFLKEAGYDIEGNKGDVFRNSSYLTYVLLKKGTNGNELSEKVSKRFSLDLKEVKFKICLVAFKDVYLEETGGRFKILIFSLLAISILVIGSINSINLSTARYLARLKEVGVKKVLGALKKHIIAQFISESLIYSLISIVLAFLLIILILPEFNLLTGKALVVSFTNVGLIAGVMLIVLFTSLVTGIYPSLFLASFNPMQLMKGSGDSMKFTSRLRKALVVFQFSLSIVLIVCSLVINKQKRYVANVNPGMNKENVIYTKLNSKAAEQIGTINNELDKIPNVAFVSSASSLPNALSSAYFPWGMDKNNRRINEAFVDDNFLKTFSIQLSQGRFFSNDYPSDINEAIVVNEAALKEAGGEAAVGKPFYYGNRYYTLIGIIKNFQNNSVYISQNEPIALRCKQKGNDYLFIKINPSIKDELEKTKVFDAVKKIVDRFSPEYPLDYRYLSELSYEIEERVNVFQQLVLCGTLFAIFIACLGLYGLSFIELSKRTKEMGIRKVIGSSGIQIFFQISFEFIRLVGISFVIACPVAYFMLDRILQTLAYRTSLSWWIFVLAGLLALGIAVITVSWQSWKAASRNPVDALRYE